MKRKWNFMFLMAIATLAVAALTTLACTRGANQETGRQSHQNGQVLTGRHPQYNETTMRFIN